MIINHEGHLRNWFKENYSKLGFDKIIKSQTKAFPDFIMEKDNKQVNVELETKASNFLLHKHPIEETDFVVCVEKDVKLPIKIIKVKRLEIKGSTKVESPYAIKNLIFPLFKKEKVLTTSEVSKKLNINWSTAEKGLLELVINGKIERIKKLGVNLWILR